MNDFEKIPTNGRAPDRLARAFGFDGWHELADGLPHNSSVLDVGAGFARLGKAVTMVRPDIAWVNLDYSYDNSAVLTKAAKFSPKNAEFVTGDATKLSNIFKAETFDTVFSYWLFPHLSLYSDWPAEEAARGIYSVTRPGGTISIGPQKLLRPAKMAESVQFQKGQFSNSDDFVEQVVSLTKLPVFLRLVQILVNETGFVVPTSIGKHGKKRTGNNH